MASVCITWVFLQAVLLWDINCIPVKHGLAPLYRGGSTGGGSSKGGSTGGGSSKGGSTGGGSSKGAVFYHPEEQVDPGFFYDPGHHKSSASSQGNLESVAVAILCFLYCRFVSLNGGSSKGGSTGGGSSKGGSTGAVPWAVPPPPMFSGGEAGPSTSNAGYMKLGLSKTSPPHPPSPPEPQLIPGELYRVENTMEDGGYESETQERGPPPPSHPYADFVARPPNSMPGGSFGYVYPYDWGFITGQYPVGTYTHSSSSVERGSDYWQDNHYIRYDYPASPEEEGGGQVKTFPSLSD
ncbi:hypothetical protein N1851_026312 [Merluccius polli]|uniref:Uncharacterized protein n=1 Tax=Merluccius polli TaxID=89951 RepID=A0AA47MC09_MERPO|nr:hypothetical protein N1851_026312 [Merluccius polli]